MPFMTRHTDGFETFRVSDHASVGAGAINVAAIGGWAVSELGGMAADV